MVRGCHGCGCGRYGHWDSQAAPVLCCCMPCLCLFSHECGSGISCFHRFHCFSAFRKAASRVGGIRGGKCTYTTTSQLTSAAFAAHRSHNKMLRLAVVGWCIPRRSSTVHLHLSRAWQHASTVCWLECWVYSKQGRGAHSVNSTRTQCEMAVHSIWIKAGANCRGADNQTEIAPLVLQLKGCILVPMQSSIE